MEISVSQSNEEHGIKNVDLLHNDSVPSVKDIEHHATPGGLNSEEESIKACLVNYEEQMIIEGTNKRIGDLQKEFEILKPIFEQHISDDFEQSLWMIKKSLRSPFIKEKIQKGLVQTLQGKAIKATRDAMKSAQCIRVIKIKGVSRCVCRGTKAAANAERGDVWAGMVKWVEGDFETADNGHICERLGQGGGRFKNVIGSFEAVGERVDSVALVAFGDEDPGPAISMMLT
ncbi:hypothetical protein DM860_013814 [Cuscuta australis]|uniref:Uncharacterized protein n=1 Tax=Cuscuta australis TaxID=267555 RepID=A0A328DL91_9ASTE|nr:hypothetical protein DM860_013814 [Cuscuta australis]